MKLTYIQVLIKKECMNLELLFLFKAKALYFILIHCMTINDGPGWPLKNKNSIKTFFFKLL